MPSSKGWTHVSGSISVLQGSQIIPIVPHVVRRHPGLAARGLHVEFHANDPAEYPEREPQQHNFYLHTGPAVRAEIKSPDFSGMRWVRPGAFWVMPQGSRHQVRFEGNTKVEGMALAFDPMRFDGLVESAGGRTSATIIQSLAASPPKIEHLMRALHHESDQPSTQDHFALECIATAVALALSQHAGATAIAAKAGTRLAPRQIRAVQAYVEGHLDQSIALAQMAAAARLSAFHFLRAFRRSVGVTPGQYVLDCRMERARSLLKSSPLTVAEVANRVGFEHASHFTRAFRRSVGVTPSLFRNSL
jgi:AraC family transcriptional regulator